MGIGSRFPMNPYLKRFKSEMIIDETIAKAAPASMSLICFVCFVFSSSVKNSSEVDLK